MRDKIEKFIIESGKGYLGVLVLVSAMYVIVLTIIFLLYSLILDNEPLKRLLE